MVAGFLAEEEGFEPPWVSPNGFQDHRVMTASLFLRMYSRLDSVDTNKNPPKDGCLGLCRHYLSKSSIIIA